MFLGRRQILTREFFALHNLLRYERIKEIEVFFCCHLFFDPPEFYLQFHISHVNVGVYLKHYFYSFIVKRKTYSEFFAELLPRSYFFTLSHQSAADGADVLLNSRHVLSLFIKILRRLFFHTFTHFFLFYLFPFALLFVHDATHIT